MIFSLVKKDFILIKKYFILILAFIICAPIFLAKKLALDNSSFLIFAITVMFSMFQANSTVFTLDEKYKGSVLLCTTPYLRNRLVKARYLFLAVIFMMVFVAYTLMSFISSLQVTKLSFTALSTTLLLASLYFSILIPLQFKLGHMKTRFISFFFIFSMPFILPTIVNYMGEINITFTIPGSSVLQGITMLLLGVTCYIFSMSISAKIFNKKNL